MAGIQSDTLVASRVVVVEHYLAGVDSQGAEALTRRLRDTGATRLRYALFLPVDETYFAVYEGPSADVRAAGGPLDRVVQAVLLEPHPNRKES